MTGRGAVCKSYHIPTLAWKHGSMALSIRVFLFALWRSAHIRWIACFGDGECTGHANHPSIRVTEIHCSDARYGVDLHGQDGHERTDEGAGGVGLGKVR